MNNDKVMFARMLNLDYLNSFDQNQLDLSDNDVTKNINNLVVTMENNKVHLRWNDCVNSAWKKAYIVKAENSIPTSVYNGNIITSYTEKNKYSTIDLIDDEISENVLYCYRVFSEFDNDAQYYSGFKNIFYVYVASVTVCNEDHEVGPVFSKDVVTDPLNRFVSDSQITLWTNKSDFNGSYNNLTDKPNFANVATSGNYNDLINKPALTTVATTGSYNDLINKPDIYQKSEIYSKEQTYSKEELYNKTEVNELIKTNKFSGNYNDLTNKPTFATIATTGSYNDLINKPDIYQKSEVYSKTETYSKEESYSKTEVNELIKTNKFSGNYNDLTNKPTLATIATTGSYNDLTSKPDIYQKSEVYSKTETYSKEESYSKTEVDNLIDGITTSLPEGNISGIYRYIPDGAENGDCQVVATKKGITFNKVDNKATLTVPEGAEILSVQVRFSGVEVGTSGKVIIKYGDNYNFTDNMFVPTYALIQDMPENRVYKLGQAATFGTEPNEIQLVGLNSNTGVVVKLTF